MHAQEQEPRDDMERVDEPLVLRGAAAAQQASGPRVDHSNIAKGNSKGKDTNVTETFGTEARGDCGH